MSKINCCNCGNSFVPSPRHKNQIYCMAEKCRKAKKAEWQRQKLKADPEYRANQKFSNKKWLAENPDYWKKYRNKNPKKVERNRTLQAIRNKRARKNKNAKMDSSDLIAKMDASKSNKIKSVGQYWLVPVIAKMDALKVNIVVIPDSFG